MHRGNRDRQRRLSSENNSGRRVLSAQQIVDAVGIAYLAGALIDYALHGTHCLITSGVHKQVRP
jgi:hypothetical protein